MAKKVTISLTDTFPHSGFQKSGRPLAGASPYRFPSIGSLD
jgi:hypothetical protein